MRIRKLLAVVFIVIALSFSAQPVRFVLKEGDSVVLILNSSNDDLTNEFIKKNETVFFNNLVSLYMKCLVSAGNDLYYNTSWTEKTNHIFKKYLSSWNFLFLKKSGNGIKKVFKEKSPERNFFFQGFEQIFGMFIWILCQ